MIWRWLSFHKTQRLPFRISIWPLPLCLSCPKPMPKICFAAFGFLRGIQTSRRSIWGRKTPRWKLYERLGWEGMGAAQGCYLRMPWCTLPVCHAMGRALHIHLWYTYMYVQVLNKQFPFYSTVGSTWNVTVETDWNSPGKDIVRKFEWRSACKRGQIIFESKQIFGSLKVL